MAILRGTRSISSSAAKPVARTPQFELSTRPGLRLNSYETRMESRRQVGEGVAAIWTLHVAAGEAHRTGHPGAAAAMLEIAEAAERAWIIATECITSRLD